MGDIRFVEYLRRLQRSERPAEELRGFSDEDVVKALAAASMERQSYLANVLASELENRIRRKNAILETTGEGVYALDVEGRVTYMNPEAERLLGWPFEALEGREMHEAVHFQDESGACIPASRCPIVRVLQRGEPARVAEDVFTRRDGTMIHIGYTSAPIVRGEEIEGAVVVFRDITELRRAEEARARLAAIMEASVDAVVGMDLAGRITAWNTAAASLFGYSEAEMRGKCIDEIVPESRRSEEETLRAQVRQGKAVAEFETERVTKTGEPLTVRLGLAPLRDTHGRVIGMAAIQHDITRRKRVEAELRLTRELAIGIGAARTFEDAVSLVLRRICKDYGWVIGQAWLPTQDRERLVLHSASHMADTRAVAFRRFSHKFTWRRGVGLPGKVWESRAPLWLEDVRTDPTFPRAPYAAEAGLAAGVAIPVLSKEQVVMIIEFFRSTPAPEDARFVELLVAVAAQLGAVIQHKSLEDEIRISEEKFRTMAQTAVDAIISADARGTITYANASAEHLFEYSEEDLVGASLVKLFPAWAEPGQEAEQLAPFLNPRAAHLVGRIAPASARTHAGQEIKVEISVSTWNASGGRYFTSIVRPLARRDREAVGEPRARPVLSVEEREEFTPQRDGAPRG